MHAHTHACTPHTHISSHGLTALVPALAQNLSDPVISFHNFNIAFFYSDFFPLWLFPTHLSVSISETPQGEVGSVYGHVSIHSRLDLISMGQEQVRVQLISLAQGSHFTLGASACLLLASSPHSLLQNEVSCLHGLMPLGREEWEKLTQTVTHSKRSLPSPIPGSHTHMSPAHRVCQLHADNTHSPVLSSAACILGCDSFCPPALFCFLLS